MPRGRAKNVFESAFGDGNGMEMLHFSRMSPASLLPLQVISPLATVEPMPLLKQLLHRRLPTLMLHARPYSYWEGGRLLSLTCSGLRRATQRTVIQEVPRENSFELPSYFPAHEIKAWNGVAG